MKIIFIVHRYHTNLFYVTKALKEAGHELRIVVPRNKAYEKLVEDHSLIEPLVIDEGELSIKFVYKKLCKWKPDLLIIRHFYGRWKLFSIIAFFLNIKRITYNQGPFYNHDFIKVLLRPYLTRLVKGQPIRRFTPVKGIHGELKEKFSTYIPFPIEPLVDISKREYFPSGVVRVLCVGKLGQERKKHFLLLNALEKINSNCSVTFIGASPDYDLSDNKYWGNLKKRCENTSLTGGAKILMDIPYKDVLKSYSIHDLFVFPAIQESLGIVVLEALASGCPVISSDDVGSAGYIESNVNGLIFRRNNLDDLVDSINYFLEKPQRIIEFGHNAVEKIKRDHSLKVFAEKITQLY